MKISGSNSEILNLSMMKDMVMDSVQTMGPKANSASNINTAVGPADQTTNSFDISTLAHQMLGQKMTQVNVLA